MMHHEHKSQAQLKFSSRPKFETLVTQVDKGLHGHGGVGGETYELSLFGGAGNHHSHHLHSNPHPHPHPHHPHEDKKSRNNSPEPIVDELTFRTSTRIIAVIDIIYSMIMLTFQLVILIGGSSYRNNSNEDQSIDETEAENRKLNLTIGVLIWMGMFAICIVQLVVAGALYGGTNERDGRKCIRNCRIWCATSIFLVIILSIEVVGVVVSNEILAFLFPLIIFTSELIFRIIGLIIISRFIKELNFELSDSLDEVNDVHYEQLIPSPILTTTTANKVKPTSSSCSPTPTTTSTINISSSPEQQQRFENLFNQSSKSPSHNPNPNPPVQQKHPFSSPTSFSSQVSSHGHERHTQSQQRRTSHHDQEQHGHNYNIHSSTQHHQHQLHTSSSHHLQPTAATTPQQQHSSNQRQQLQKPHHPQRQYKQQQQHVL